MVSTVKLVEAIVPKRRVGGSGQSWVLRGETRMGDGVYSGGFLPTINGCRPVKGGYKTPWKFGTTPASCGRSPSVLTLPSSFHPTTTPFVCHVGARLRACMFSFVCVRARV